MSEAGARVGALELVAPLGAGGQGEVWLAWPWAEGPLRRAARRLLVATRLRAGPLPQEFALRWRLAALKLARPAMADSLHDEHQYLAATGAAHPHLVGLYRARFPGAAGADLSLARAGPEPLPRLCLRLAYEPGEPLSGLLVRWGSRRPAWPWSVAVVAQLARALAHLHGRGVVHHDVRPANVIVRSGPRAVLIDLGAAERVGGGARAAVYGAPAWLAPERLGATPAPASPLVDVYGAGALLGALTEGAPAPTGLTRLIEEATTPDPARRAAAIPTMAALLERLAGL